LHKTPEFDSYCLMIAQDHLNTECQKNEYFQMCSGRQNQTFVFTPLVDSITVYIKIIV